MRRFPSILATFAVAALAVILLGACSTKKNTAKTRFWHAFNARFNTYFNGSEAYKDGCLAKETGNEDNYTERLPFFTVANEQSRTLGKSNFETAITKCEKAIQLHSIKKKPVVSAGKRRSPKMKAYLSRQEFNPFLKKAWILMGMAQFQKGDFVGAASTFAYITRHYAAEPEVVAEARVWLARCYSQLDWFYDAEDALSKLNRDSIPRRLYRERDATTADLLLRQERLADALPYLQRAAKREPRKLQRARLYFLLGQVQTTLGDNAAAYKAYGKCIRLSPPYKMAFNARILQTEVMGSSDYKKILAKLKRMARSPNNKEYLDQVYYAIGNIHLSRNDTAQAVSAYEKGRAEATRSGVEKGILLLKLGGVYWDMGRYDRAQTCYSEAIGLIEKTHKDYADITRRSKVLDELVPYTSAVQLQDSLLELSVMPEAERNEAIDRVIEELKRKEEAERRASADSAAMANMPAGSNTNTSTAGQNNTKDGQTWYFYNPTMVTQGKQSFQRQWGNRKNEDNWRRSNRSVLASAADDAYDYEAEDSLAAAELAADTMAVKEEAADSAQNDPHQREYYLAQIPFTEEAKEACHAIIQDGLYNAGIIEKDKLEDFALAARTLTRLYQDYPAFEKLEDVYYQLFLLYSRWQKPDEAERYRQLMASVYPESSITRQITDPNFEYYARYGKEIEDSLYTSAYAAYRDRDNATVERLFNISTEKYPRGANRPKFIFVHALSRIGTADAKDIMEELRDLVKQFPESDVSEMAGLMVRGLESGRLLTSGGFDVSSLWERRSAEANAAVDEAGRRREFTADRDVPFVCIIAYPTDSLDDGLMLYNLAHFNFTGFKVRNFDITQLRDAALTQLRVAGFTTFDEAHYYVQQLYQDAELAPDLRKSRIFLVSAANLDLIGTTYSFNDYQEFYDKTYAPLKLNPQLPLDFQGLPVEQHYEDEYTPEELQQLQDGEDGGTGGSGEEDDDDGEWYTP